MSFATESKQELLKLDKMRPCCRKSECYGMLLFTRLFSLQNGGYHTDNGLLARRLAEMAGTVAGVIAQVDTTLRKSTPPSFSVTIPNRAERVSLLHAFGHTGQEDHLRTQTSNFQGPCCKSAFLRGAFLVSGTVSDPYKEYHLEFFTPHHGLAEDLLALLAGIGNGQMQPAVLKRKGNYVIYLKESERIADLLTYIGANNAAMELMQAKMFKEVRNYVNRKTNFETANIDKTVSAAIRQTEAIEKVVARYGMEAFPEGLRELATLRLENPEMSLREMAVRLGLSRSGVNHRLQRIMEIANREPEKTDGAL